MSAVLEEETTLDTDKMSTDLAADLGSTMELSPRDDTTLDALEPDDTKSGRDAAGRFAKADVAPPDDPAQPAGDPAAPVLTDLPVPASWAKEMHPIWDKLSKGVPLSADESRKAATYYNTRESQMAEGAKGYANDAEYGRTLKGVISKHEDVLRAQGLDAPKAVDFLFNAHRQLSSGTREERQAYLARVAKSYGLEIGGAPNQAPTDQTAETPAMRELRERQERIEQSINADNQRRFEEHKANTAAEVEAFATDPKNIHFDECADHICMLLKSDPKMKLGEAYETAVWANPVTRQKELNRISQETEKANRARAAEAAKAAKKGTSANVRGRDTARAPTAPAATLANLDDVMRETHDEMKAAH